MSETLTESTPVSNGSNEEMLKEASNLFIQGKRNLLIHDYKSAVECLENSCRLYDTIYGVSADECGDAYLQYGIALMELARQETGVLDGVVSAQAETESSEEEEEEDADEKADENGSGADGEGEAKAEDAEKAAQIAADEELAKSLAEEDIAGDTIPAASASAGGSCSSAAAGAGGSSAAEPTPSSSAGATAADPAEEEEDGEPSSFECAWELLCLARDVFKRQIEYTAENLAGGEKKWKESKMKLAEALQSLGEISIEWENNEAALDLLQESLTLRKEVLTPDDRLIAETYYHIGIAHSFMNEPERANDCFRSAMSVIEDRIKNLKSSVESSESTICTEGASCDGMDETKLKNDRNRKEIKELESLLPEMAAKIEDSKDQVKSTSQVLKQLDDEESRDNQLVAKIHDSPMKPVNNITHLVKRKREAEIENGNGESVKKLCPANGCEDSSKNGSQPST